METAFNQIIKSLNISDLITSEDIQKCIDIIAKIRKQKGLSTKMYASVFCMLMINTRNDQEIFTLSKPFPFDEYTGFNLDESFGKYIDVLIPLKSINDERVYYKLKAEFISVLRTINSVTEK